MLAVRGCTSTEIALEPNAIRPHFSSPLVVLLRFGARELLLWPSFDAPLETLQLSSDVALALLLFFSDVTLVV